MKHLTLTLTNEQKEFIVDHRPKFKQAGSCTELSAAKADQHWALAQQCSHCSAPLKPECTV